MSCGLKCGLLVKTCGVCAGRHCASCLPLPHTLALGPGGAVVVNATSSAIADCKPVTMQERLVCARCLDTLLGLSRCTGWPLPHPCMLAGASGSEVERARARFLPDVAIKCAHACAQSYVPESLLLANTQAGVRHRELLLLDQVWRERGGVEACGSL